MPAYIYASREDHIVPWQAPIAVDAACCSGKKRFVLGASGHIAGVINPPAKKKRSHWTADDKLPADARRTGSRGANEHPGSWWTDWAGWLKPPRAASRSPRRRRYGKAQVQGRSSRRPAAT